MRCINCGKRIIRSNKNAQEFGFKYIHFPEMFFTCYQDGKSRLFAERIKGGKHGN